MNQKKSGKKIGDSLQSVPLGSPHEIYIREFCMVRSRNHRGNLQSIAPRQPLFEALEVRQMLSHSSHHVPQLHVKGSHVGPNRAQPMLIIQKNPAATATSSSDPNLMIMPLLPKWFTPAQIRHAYGFDQVGLNGAGQTIAIVDAFNNPTIRQD